MFKRIKQRLQDMRTVRALCEGAERYARQDGQPEPGAEHFALAALDLPDGTAGKAFARLRIDPERFREAIRQQYVDALAGLGFDTARTRALLGEPAPLAAESGVYRAQASGRGLMQRLAARQGTDAGRPLLGADVLTALADCTQGPAARALARLGVEPDALRRAAQEEARGAAAG